MKKIEKLLEGKTDLEKCEYISTELVEKEKSGLLQMSEKIEILKHSLTLLPEGNSDTTFLIAKINFQVSKFLSFLGSFTESLKHIEKSRELLSTNSSLQDEKSNKIYYSMWIHYISIRVKKFDNKFPKYEKLINEFLSSIKNEKKISDEKYMKTLEGLGLLQKGVLLGIKVDQTNDGYASIEQGKLFHQAVEIFHSLKDYKNLIYAKYKLAESRMCNGYRLKQMIDVQKMNPQLTKELIKQQVTHMKEFDLEQLEIASKELFDVAKDEMVYCIKNYDLSSNEILIFLEIKRNLIECFFNLKNMKFAYSLCEEYVKLIIKYYGYNTRRTIDAYILKSQIIEKLGDEYLSLSVSFLVKAFNVSKMLGITDENLKDIIDSVNNKRKKLLKAASLGVAQKKDLVPLKKCSYIYCSEVDRYNNISLKTCSKCKSVFYCTRRHQVLDWKKFHKQVCKPEVKPPESSAKKPEQIKKTEPIKTDPVKKSEPVKEPEPVKKKDEK